MMKARDITIEQIDRIMDSHEAGLTLKAACRIEGLEHNQVWYWLQQHAPHRYAMSRKISAHAMVDAIVEKVSTCTDPVQAHLLRIQFDVIKWTASKVDPTYFGDRQTLALEAMDSRVGIGSGHFISRNMVEAKKYVIIPELEGPVQIPDNED